MKKITFFICASLLCMFISGNLSAQFRKIPAQVTTAFSEKYPDATGIEWKDKLTAFSAGFELDSVWYVASFNNEGKWLGTEHEITLDELPEQVSNGFEKSRFADWEVLKVEEIELPGEELNYRVGVGKSEFQKRNLYFNSKGRMIKDKLTL